MQVSLPEPSGILPFQNRHRMIRLKGAVCFSNSPLLRLMALCLLASTYLTSNASAQCLSNGGRELRQDGSWLWQGVLEAPRNVVRTRNLKWELPIVAATGVLIGSGDTPASRLIQNPSLQRQAKPLVQYRSLD
jgi:hypothetical protein